MMRFISGIFVPDSGRFVAPSETKVGYLPQEKKLQSDKTVIAETLTTFAEANNLERAIEKYTQEISDRQDYESESYQRLIGKLSEANERYALIGGNLQKARAEKVLTGLGFDGKDLLRPMSEFSGGWQMRVELAKILLQDPDLLLLDEPTNHLDIESIQWIETFLADYSGAVILVSHDRAFLDNVTSRTIEISKGRIYDYKACFTDYETLREERLEQETAMFNNQQRQVVQIERFINRFRAKATKARQVQSRIKLLEKMDRIEVDQLDDSGIHFRFNQAPPSGKVVIEAHKIKKAYGDKTVLKDVEFMINRGERVAFVGRNGEGKTTLSKIMAGILEYEGTLKHGHNIVIGYFAQNQAEYLDGEKNVFQTLDEVAVGDVRTRIRGILGGFLFQGDDVEKKVKVLSGGEKSRLAIAKLLLMPVNFLILDEPTNHLDMRSKDILKSALLQFDGTVVVVSHDRDFLQGLTTKVYEFKGGGIKEFIGDIYDFIDSRNIKQLTELDQAFNKAKQGQKLDKSEQKNLWDNKKEIEKQTRKILSRIEKCEKEMESIELKIKEAEKTLHDPSTNTADIDSIHFYQNYSSLKSQLLEQEQLWEDLHKELENSIKQSNPG